MEIEDILFLLSAASGGLALCYDYHGFAYVSLWTLISAFWLNLGRRMNR